MTYDETQLPRILRHERTLREQKAAHDEAAETARALGGQLHPGNKVHFTREALLEWEKLGFPASELQGRFYDHVVRVLGEHVEQRRARSA